jgi:hypothetical protein
MKAYARRREGGGTEAKAARQRGRKKPNSFADLKKCCFLKQKEKKCAF